MTSAGGLGDLIRDPDEAIRRMDEWAAGFARKAERYAAAQQETERLRLTASSPDGTVKVTVGADGVVSDLVFGSKTRTMPQEELARMVLDTMRRAQSGITQRVAEVMTENLGDEDQDTRSALLGSLRSRFPDLDQPEDGPGEPEPPAPTPPPVPPAPSAGGAATPPPPAAPPGPAGPAAPRRRGGIDPDEQDNNPW
ncbi:YbaB/EbfC family nucleoid-associated protein [Amycolatopsis carbonis]|uniref:YbaB/EbfC family nucleoid-associated protein n=1 Tax=Amycolatopsis carbonis TaxID=715471 RepID=A0A9Y2IAX5_9PSEU|nr:YbaB/EbfC family nucleoid-associated protein [Amycolatopsis sp. 2-15]WIX75765.1 YbaB/EbfC family nucleoid-associated protein [Amycolatopsis sp. 2-15]